MARDEQMTEKMGFKITELGSLRHGCKDLYGRYDISKRTIEFAD